MTIRPRAVKALRDVRERLRDVAASTHATAATARDASSAALVLVNDRLEANLAGASATLAAARTIYEVELVEEDTGVHRLAVADATVERDNAIAITEVTAGKLRERTRQLRSAEKLVELVEEHRNQRDARIEQRGNDDMSARRR